MIQHFVTVTNNKLTFGDGTKLTVIGKKFLFFSFKSLQSQGFLFKDLHLFSLSLLNWCFPDVVVTQSALENRLSLEL